MEAVLEAVLPYLDGFAGLAALVNGLLLWPIVRTLKDDHNRSKTRQDERLDNHETRITYLERP
jgi:hypothetical protein